MSLRRRSQILKFSLLATNSFLFFYGVISPQPHALNMMATNEAAFGDTSYHHQLVFMAHLLCFLEVLRKP